MQLQYLLEVGTWYEGALQLKSPTHYLADLISLSDVQWVAIS
jgi:hypothetical protein